MSLFSAQLQELSAMGFNNTQLNTEMLQKNGGNVNAVCQWLLENGQSEQS